MRETEQAERLGGTARSRTAHPSRRNTHPSRRNARRRFVILSVLGLTCLIGALISLERSGEARITAAASNAAQARLDSQTFADLRAQMTLALTMDDTLDDPTWRARANQLAKVLARRAEALASRSKPAEAAALRKHLSSVETALVNLRTAERPRERLPLAPKITTMLDAMVDSALRAREHATADLRRANRRADGVRIAILATALAMVGVLIFGAARRTPRGPAPAPTLDNLTGLADRIAFSQLIAARTPATVKRGSARDGIARAHHVILIDIQGFHTVNATHGYKVGDALLWAVADRLRTIAGTDRIARVGIDEYAILTDIPRTSETVLDEARRALDAIAAPIEAAGKTIEMIACAGVAPIAAGDDSDTVLRNVKLALSTAKAALRTDTGTVRLFTAEVEDEYNAIMEEERRIVDALESRRFVPHYQPIVDLKSTRTIGAEALVRLPLPSGDVLAPGQFLPQLELRGRLNDLTWIVLEKACTVASRWPEELFVSVNVPPAQISVEFADDVMALIDRLGFAPQRLQLEILESGFADGGGRMVEALEQLRQHGIRIALDDFGVGYSSLGQLSRLPVDKVKIDRSFVQAIDASDLECRDCTGSEHIPCALIRAAVDLCAAIGLEVVAEGVETREQRSCVTSVGCGSAQGYYWGKPMPADEFSRWIATERAAPPQPAAKAQSVAA